MFWNRKHHLSFSGAKPAGPVGGLPLSLAAAGILALLCCLVFLGRGFWILGFQNDKPVDASLRWRENSYVLKGVNPYDLSEYLYRVESGQPASHPPPKLDPMLGATKIASGYPPWAFPAASLFLPPVHWQASRIWFLLLNIIALTVIARFVWIEMRTLGILPRIAGVAMALSPNAVGTTLGNGQWGIILCAALLLSAILGRDSRIMPAGLCYFIALLKPTFSFAHAAIFLQSRRSFAILFLAGLLTLAAGELTARHVGTTMIGMLSQMLSQTSRWNDSSYGIADLLVHAGLPRGLTILASLAAGTALAFILVHRVKGDLLYQLAVCCACSRLFAYHQLYDNMMILFLAAALFRACFRSHSPVNVGILYLILLSLWIPGRFTALPSVQISQIFIWLFGVAWLYYCGRLADTDISQSQDGASVRSARSLPGSA